MAATFVQGNAAAVPGAPNTGTCAYTGNVTAGNLLVVCFGTTNVAPGFTISDSPGNSYTPAFVTAPSSAGIPFAAQIYYAIAKSSAANTVTLNQSAGFSSTRIWVHEYSGVDTLDVTASNSGSSATLSSGAATSTQATELIFGLGISNSGVTSNGAGFTLRETAGSESTEDQNVTSTGSQTVTFPTSSSAWLCLMATFYLSGAAAAVDAGQPFAREYPSSHFGPF